MDDCPDVYQPRRQGSTRRVRVRSLELNLWCWEPLGASSNTLVAVHGWMDLGASFQFLVDNLPNDWRVIAPDWRGFGHSSRTPSDSYWFYDYLGDLDGILNALLPNESINLLGHSMGGNLVMLYGGARPQRIRRLINLEGAGLRRSNPSAAPGRIAKWLDQLITAQTLRPYESTAAVARRLLKNNGRLRPDRAAWLAGKWSEKQADGEFRLLADPAHKKVNPYLHRTDEVDACWAAIEAPVLWVDSSHPNDWHAFTKKPEFRQRTALVKRLTHQVLADSGHMLHHDQPEALARLVQDFVVNDD